MRVEAIRAVVEGAKSYWLQSDKVELYITEEGGHLGPVHFKLKHRWVSPYNLSPWLPGEVPKDISPVLKILRGDFFCLPFGNPEGRGPLHGETANSRWELVKAGILDLAFEMKLKAMGGTVGKRIHLLPGQRVVYQEHRVSGLRGRFNYGYHPILHFPDKGGPFFINLSPFKFGMVEPDSPDHSVGGESNALEAAATFQSLGKVSLSAGGKTSLHEYPAREGFDDRVMVSGFKGNLSWTAVTLNGYVWFSLKNPKILPSTLLWFSNGGRLEAPWEGRFRRRMGIAEAASFFAEGVETARKDLLKDQGIPTTRRFSRSRTISVRIIQGVHPVRKDFGMVEKITPLPEEDGILIRNREGVTVSAPVKWGFLEG